MKKLLLLTLLLHIIGSPASSQELKAKKAKTLVYYEEYNVLTTNKKVRHGDYKKYRTDASQILKGKLDNNNKIGEWNYFENGNLEQTYSYDEKKMIFQKKPSNRYTVKIEGQIKVLNVDTPPTYVGSKIALTDELNHIIEYPLQARRMGIEGPVTVGVWINADSSLGDVQVIKGIMKDCDQEALSALKKIPNNWIAATLDGKGLESMLVITIVYGLDNLSQSSAVTVQ